MNVHVEASNGKWILTDLNAKKDRIKIFDHLPTMKEILEFVEENKK